MVNHAGRIGYYPLLALVARSSAAATASSPKNASSRALANGGRGASIEAGTSGKGGSGNSNERAWRMYPPGRGEPPYFTSPLRGWARDAAWALIWWVRPEWSRTRRRLRPPPEGAGGPRPWLPVLGRIQRFSGSPGPSRACRPTPKGLRSPRRRGRGSA